ncbi:NAD(P)H-nitrite reductase [Mycobacteroides abscessus]|uniref:NAD(P)/FAD-dependent oxidoreductase n=2 Tax=Mycobacteroides abscessus TaxID=36809 RepID=UPI0005E1A5AA|nr:FAD/NAD(P)-binding oxidoreductase [Mycobacteroides abscessus]CPT92140.1 NAD(P)H-nitrite reductase [Mycobacteroides abscessus]CPW40986.1 NAD(P)H-nitrite reductase [Mycobacteroides abscessus]
MALERIVIVGGGAAALAVAESARTTGYSGALTMINGEQHLPYDRPPLSKQLLTGQWTPDQLALRAPDDLDRLDLDLRQGVRATAVDTAARTVDLDDGQRVDYDALVIATGVAARWLPGSRGVEGVHVLRDLDDALRLRADLDRGGPLVVIGAGVLGVEAAAVARQRGLDVTVVDPLPLPMMRVVGNDVGTLIAQIHRERGVDLRCNTAVRKLLTADGRVTGVDLQDGSVLPAATVLVAIGASPDLGWLDGSGIPIGGPGPEEGGGGIQCGAAGRVVDGVWAAGDVAAWPRPDGTGWRRVEHRLNATEQGRAVARAILDPTYVAPDAIPYFWSDQYEYKIQSYGLPGPDDRFTVAEGTLADRKFVGAYTAGGVITGVLGIGMPRALRTWRAQIGEPAPQPVT